MSESKKGLEKNVAYNKQVEKRLVRNFVESGIRLRYLDSEFDKYTFEHEAQVDFLNRLSVCKAVNIPLLYPTGCRKRAHSLGI